MGTTFNARRPHALLCVADYHGTLAAVRSLGRAGISVAVADWRSFVAARWSRYAVRRLTCPSLESSSDAFMSWLLDFGAREPGHVLLATTDDLAWLFARHRHELSKYFLLEAPALSTVNAVLNKWQLREACLLKGIGTPEAMIAGEGRNRPCPLIVKPQTQVLLSPHQKGVVVRDARDIDAAVTRFQAATRYDRALLHDDPGVVAPILQEYVEPTERGIYSLSGWVDDTHVVVNASRKVFQRPLRLGIGLCFEAAPVDEELAARVLAMCRYLGFRGVFEIEILEHEDRKLLIDFNPRFFGQMAFDIARGADLPLMAYQHAVGDRVGLQKTINGATQPQPNAPAQWCDRIGLTAFLSLLQLTRRIASSDARRWASWLGGAPLDAVGDWNDWMPGAIAAAQAFVSQVRHPRATLRSAFEN